MNTNTMTILNPDKDLSDAEKLQITVTLKDAIPCIKNGTLVHFTVFTENAIDLLFDNEGIIRLTGWRDTNVKSGTTRFQLQILKQAYDEESNPLTIKLND